MTFQGTIILTLPRTEGEKNGRQWVRGGFVVESDPDERDYTQKLAFDSMRKDVLDQADILLNKKVEVTFFPESREYNDRWFTSLKATRLSAIAVGFPHNPAPQAPAAAPETTTPYIQGAFDSDPDLPF